MKTLRRLLVLFLVLTGLPNLPAQVPQLLSYQGRVAVGATNFDGTGLFKFALLDPSGATYWSNDNSSVAGSEPADAVTLTVAKGLYSVLLGDTSLENMKVVPHSVFGKPDIALRVWFDDGVNGSQLLTPDQPIAAVGYAMIAANVSNGAITTAKLAPGAVTSTQLAPGAAAANLNAGSQSGVASGGLVLSTTDNNSALVTAGYLKIGATVTTNDQWQQRALAPLSPRYGHTAVWTGTEMIVWGGYNGATQLGDGARFNPATNTWTALSAPGGPAARYGHTAIWTGTEMIIWGGLTAAGFTNDGARYNPTTNTWTPLPTAGAPAVRATHTAVWTGTKMVVWGGWNGPALNSGGRYDLATDAWAPMSTSPAARYNHTAVWTGSTMVMWGGENPNIGAYYANGGRYDPVGDTWSAVSNTGEPAIRSLHSAVWTGTEMFLWGGSSSAGLLNTGGRYNPVSDTWAPVNTVAAPTVRRYFPVVWTGSEVIVWGGAGNSGALGDGSRYDPVSNSWKAISTAGAPPSRYSHSAVWSGSEMIIFGGNPPPIYFNDTWSYAPSRPLYLYQRP